MKKEEQLQIIKECFEGMRPFKNIDDLPSIPVVNDPKFYQEVIVTNLERCGAIPKKDLIPGCEYLGSCRNSSVATWDGEKFEYTRTKWGYKYKETINHYEDDNGFDLFIPLKLKENDQNI